MIGGKKFEHAALWVDDLATAASFYVDVLGLDVVEETDRRCYLGCGYDGRYDVALAEGGTGVEHFALRVPGEPALQEYEDRLSAADVAFERTDGTEPSQDRGLRFSLPSGTDMEFVVVDDGPYTNPALSSNSPAGATPLDVDHVNLMNREIDADVAFLRETLGLRLTEAFERGDEGFAQAWLRAGDYHHDVGIGHTPDPDTTLHHLAWYMADVSHVVDAADALSRAGHQLEVGINRHTVGASVYAYAWTPGGNRIEFCGEMASIDAWEEPIVHETRTERSSLTVWGGVEQPDSWTTGS